MTKEVTRYFNILECGKNLLDRLDVTYQQAFMATPQDKNYTELLANVIKVNNRKGEPFSNERLRQLFIDVRKETDTEHEHNINEITCDDSYKSPMKKKDVSTIRNSVYYKSDENVDPICDCDKHVDLRNNPIAETHIVAKVHSLSVRVGIFKPAVIIGGSIRPVTNVLENSPEDIPLDSLGVNRNILNCTFPDIRNIRRNNSWIGTPHVNEGIFSPSHDLTETSRLQI